MVTSVPEGFLLQEYIEFCRIYQEVLEEYGQLTEEAIAEIFRRYEDKGILQDYLKKRKVEVNEMMRETFEQRMEKEAYFDMGKDAGRSEREAEIVALQDVVAKKDQELLAKDSVISAKDEMIFSLRKELEAAHAQIIF